jgi:hypothetical protein
MSSKDRPSPAIARGTIPSGRFIKVDKGLSGGGDTITNSVTLHVPTVFHLTIFTSHELGGAQVWMGSALCGTVAPCFVVSFGEVARQEIAYPPGLVARPSESTCLRCQVESRTNPYWKEGPFDDPSLRFPDVSDA